MAEINSETKTLPQGMKEHCILISVVRDEVMYQRIVADNPKLVGYEKRMLDNRKENLGIPTRYNQFLDEYDYTQPAWFVFCHEDMEFLQDLSILCDVSHDSLYGTIGVTLRRGIRDLTLGLWGREKNSNKDGTGCCWIGRPVHKPHRVLTFDCQCLIVHSDLVRKHHLRFDEHLTFDLYVEDFCIGASESHGIRSYVIPINCHHYSFGNIQPRFTEQLHYLQEKYKHSRRCYASTVGMYTIGRNVKGRLKHDSGRIRDRLKRFLYQTKQTQSGHRIVKLLRIPIYRRKIS